jgi:hypothetical protein
MPKLMPQPIRQAMRAKTKPRQLFGPTPQWISPTNTGQQEKKLPRWIRNRRTQRSEFDPRLFYNSACFDLATKKPLSLKKTSTETCEA